MIYNINSSPLIELDIFRFLVRSMFVVIAAAGPFARPILEQNINCRIRG